MPSIDMEGISLSRVKVPLSRHLADGSPRGGAIAIKSYFFTQAPPAFW